MDRLGLRERKKRRTREAISRAAFALFRESGFDAVAVADIAAAAEVSKPTVFAYFPTKEDLVLRRFLSDELGPAQAVRDRPDGLSPLAALRQSFLDRLAAREPLTGLSDAPDAVTFHELLYTTPSVMARLTVYMRDQERLLAGELRAAGQAPDDLAAWLLASQVFGIQRVLSEHNAQQIRAGRSAESVYPEAVERARTAYDLIEKGLAGLEQPGA
ncbi:TetR/AcrR family transcriptional regulator [Streptomyces sp. 7-21]|jgi:AcrR family transcriptional regulator|uniref:TetR/AcrR family transcriptional regulator n=1 Tax=Streptomyces sp. 7-21 TaxID=2802283 RepID=UPI00191C92B9|nr:TetR family transcriptional regulator [Streptomyces sp. 7-21]MBL1067411.1 TetR family transcriptional regulator [Streptomyces sp. 7-21]